MRSDKVLLPAVFCVLALSASAQAVPARPADIARQTPLVEVGLGYDFLHANAPPSGCGCFSLNGGGGTVVFHATHGLGFAADLFAAHASNVNNTTQNITVFDYLFGPRYSLRSAHRVTPYAEVLAGGSKEFSNYTYVQGANGFALNAGGGVNLTMGRRVGWNVVEADYVYSRLPNGVNTRQNDLRIATGVVFRFGAR